MTLLLSKIEKNGRNTRNTITRLRKSGNGSCENHFVS